MSKQPPKLSDRLALRTGEAAEAAGQQAIPACFARRVTLSRTEVAETLGCSQDFVDSLISDEKLGAWKVRHLVFVVAQDVWALAGAVEPQPRGSAEARSILRRLEA